MFPLCRTCAETMSQTECKHSEQERSIVGTWVSEELKLAVKHGYKIIQVSKKKYMNFFCIFLCVHIDIFIHIYLLF